MKSFRVADSYGAARVRRWRWIVICVLAWLSLLGGQAAFAERPNVLLIYTDDQGCGDASCLNPRAKFSTPNLDRLAREGLVFPDAHSSDTVCTPSRYGLLTGRYSWRTTLKRGVFGAERPCLISDERTTIASLLREQGYRTAMVGKWHLGMDFPGDVGNRDWSQPVVDMPLDKGFGYFYGIPASMNYGVLAWFEGRFAKVPPVLYTAKKPNQMALSDYRIMPPYDATPEATRARLGKEGMEIAADFVDSECLTRFTDKALAWLEQHCKASSKPFFLYLPYTSPHKPVVPLEKFRGLGAAGAYGEFMVETDYHVGRILEFLDEHALTDETLLIFTSDNGPETTWRARRKKYQHASNHVYREGKRSVYEGGHRVPFLVRWPQGIETPGRRCDTPICQTDVLATLADVLDVELSDNAGEDSQSFVDAFRDEQAMVRKPMIHHAANGRFAIRDGRWKLVMPHKSASVELYDLASDIAEKENVAEQSPDTVKQLTTKITQIVSRGRTTDGDIQPNDTDYWDDLTWMTEDQYASDD